MLKYKVSIFIFIFLFSFAQILEGSSMDDEKIVENLDIYKKNNKLILVKRKNDKKRFLIPKSKKSQYILKLFKVKNLIIKYKIVEKISADKFYINILNYGKKQKSEPSMKKVIDILNKKENFKIKDFKNKKIEFYYEGQVYDGPGIWIFELKLENRIIYGRYETSHGDIAGNIHEAEISEIISLDRKN